MELKRESIAEERYRKISLRMFARSRDLPETLVVVIWVSEDGYVPVCVERRVSITKRILTANISRDHLQELDDDPKVCRAVQSDPFRHLEPVQ
jgi:hypothetical protein